MKFFQIAVIISASFGLATTSCERHSFDETQKLYHGHGGHDDHGEHSGKHDDQHGDSHAKHDDHSSDKKKAKKAYENGTKSAPKKGEAKDVGI